MTEARRPLSPDSIDLRVLNKLNAQDSFEAFVKQAWLLLEPRTRLLWSWHLSLIAEWLEEIRAGRCTRLIVNVPPRSMKSTLISIMFPVWTWATKPEMRFLCASYSATLALKHSRDRRALLTSPWYQGNWHLRLADDSNRQDEYTNANRGHMIASSVGASVTGRGGDALIVDDLINPEQANSEAERNAALRFFDESLYSRLDDKRRGVIVVVEQRTHASDLTGHLLPEGNWLHLCLPTEFDTHTVYSLPRSGKKVECSEGDLLWPSRDGQAELDAAKARVGSYAYTLQYLQRPTARGGNIFKREYFGTFPMPPRRFDRIVQSWDCAFKQGQESDYSVCVTLGYLRTRDSANGSAPGYYVLHVARGRWTFGQLTTRAVELAAEWRPQSVLIEDTASGQSLLQVLKHQTALPVKGVKPDTDKLSRAHAAEGGG